MPPNLTKRRAALAPADDAGLGQARLRASVQRDHPAGRRRLRFRFHARPGQGLVRASYVPSHVTHACVRLHEPERRAVAILEPAPAQGFRHRLHHGVVADEQDGGLRMTVEPLADAGQRADREPTATVRRPAAGWWRASSTVFSAALRSSSPRIERPSKLPKSHSMMPSSTASGLPDAAAMISAVFDARDQRAADDVIE